LSDCGFLILWVLTFVVATLIFGFVWFFRYFGCASGFRIGVYIVGCFLMVVLRLVIGVGFVCVFFGYVCGDAGFWVWV